MLFSDLYFRILSFLDPKLNYFLVSKLFNNLCNEVYFEDKRYSTEKILVRFQAKDYLRFAHHNDDSVRTNSQMYKFTSWNKYRLYKSLTFSVCVSHKCSGYRHKHCTYLDFVVEKIIDKKVIEFAKEKIEYLNITPMNLDYNFFDKKYILKNQKKINDNRGIVYILPYNFLEYLTWNLTDLKFYIRKEHITDEAIRVAEKNECFENLKMYRVVILKSLS